MLELVLQAAKQLDGDDRPAAIEELLFHAPIVLPAAADLHLQVKIGEPGPAGRRPVSVHSRASGEPWVQNATGRLCPSSHGHEASATMPWPPPGAQPLDVTGLYQRLAGQGYTFGPAFRSLRQAWHDDEHWYTEVRLSAEYAADAGRYAIHPALLDSAAHPRLDAFGGPAGGPDGGVPILFAASDVQLYRSGSPVLRSRLSRRGPAGLMLEVADEQGRPVARVGSLDMRAIDPALLSEPPARQEGTLLRPFWTRLPVPAGLPAQDRWVTVGDSARLKRAGLPIEAYPDVAALGYAVAAGIPAPEVVFACLPGGAVGDDLAAAARAAAQGALALVKEWLLAPRLATARLVVTTSGALDPADGRIAPDQAAAWGLVRSAQAEHPGRLVLLDIDDDQRSWAVVPGCLDAQATADVTEYVVRQGLAYQPGVAHSGPASPARRPALDPAATVLITGGTGALGRQLARHLATAYGVRRLVLTGRSGAPAPELARLSADLEALGTTVTVTACDVADVAAMAALLAGLPAEHPLGMVVHAAGVLDDGIVAELTAERLERVLRPKVAGAVNLHELTRDLPVTQFVLFSFAAATLGPPGQASYAAANAFLDALASSRRHAGLPALSLAWGPWTGAGGMADRLDEREARRLRRLGVAPFEPDAGMALFDAALSGTTRGQGEPVLLPVRLESPLPESAPAVLRRAVGHAVPARAGSVGDSSVGDPAAVSLESVPPAERAAAVLDLVRSHASAVLGYEPTEQIDPERPFLELGFTSLMAVELRNQVSDALGVKLAATVTFEHPTAARLAAHLCAEHLGVAPPGEQHETLLTLEPLA